MGTGVVMVGQGVSQGLAAGAYGVLGQKANKDQLLKDARKNLEVGSRTCPILSELKEMKEGLEEGDVEPVVLNGMIVLSAVGMAWAVKLNLKNPRATLGYAK